jgi:hypothetical protein
VSHKSGTIGCKKLYMPLTWPWYRCLRGTSNRQSWSWGVLWRHIEHIILCLHFPLLFPTYRTSRIGLKLKKNPLTCRGVAVGIWTRNRINTIYRDIILSDNSYGLYCSLIFFFAWQQTAQPWPLIQFNRESGSTPFSSVFVCWKCFPSARRPLLL